MEEHSSCGSEFTLIRNDLLRPEDLKVKKKKRGGLDGGWKVVIIYNSKVIQSI